MTTNETKRELAEKLLEVAEITRRNCMPFSESQETNDVKAIGQALAIVLRGEIPSLASVFYFALKDTDENIASEFRQYFEKTNKVLINGHRHTPKVMGLPVQVLRGIYDTDTTNGGVSSKRDRFILIGDGIPEVAEPRDEDEILVLKTRNILGKYDYHYVVPYALQDGHSMMGGNYIHSADGRFPNKYPLAIHDRVE